MSYAAFLENKRHTAGDVGFTPTFTPNWLFDFQLSLVEWSCRNGRSAVFADCGLGKTPMQLVWAQNVVQHTNGRVLILAPLAASAQTTQEAQKFDIEATRSRDGQFGAAKIVVTNYERLHLFSPADFQGVVCDESSILKNFDGATKAAVTEFVRRVPYRLLATATAAPNDYIELGTSSEALGRLGFVDMLGMFFKNTDGNVAMRTHGHEAKWRFKPHAEQAFWRWMCSWARAVRKPSDLGFDDGAFVLPPLSEQVTVIEASRPLPGQLFVRPAETLQEQREERRATLVERCEAVAQRAITPYPFVGWCHLNDEADLLERLIPDSRQISGANSDDEKEELFEAFRTGQLRALITKPRIGAFGLNWQHCAHMSFFPSHSYEQYYQAVRRCWRFGQTRQVVVDVISTAGESDVMANLQRKSAAADRMFASMVQEMSFASHMRPRVDTAVQVSVPSWVKEVSHV